MKKDKELVAKIKPFQEVMAMKAIDILKYFREHHEAMYEEYSVEEMNAIQCRMIDFMYDEKQPLKQIPEANKANRRSVWIANHTSIIHAIHTYIKSHGAIPPVPQISKETKLSRVTVTKHLKYFEKDEFLNFHRQKWKLATENLMKQLYASAFKEYDASVRLKAANLYLKYADKILYPASNRNENEGSQTNNFIQINNTYVTQETIKALPEDKRQTIETLIMEANEPPKKVLR